MHCFLFFFFLKRITSVRLQSNRVDLWHTGTINMKTWQSFNSRDVFTYFVSLMKKKRPPRNKFLRQYICKKKKTHHDKTNFFTMHRIYKHIRYKKYTCRCTYYVNVLYIYYKTFKINRFISTKLFLSTYKMYNLEIIILLHV